jgi:hypothetical protein
MKDWITEYTDYSQRNRLCKKDLLDAAAYQIQIARPGVPQPLGRNRTAEAEAVEGTVVTSAEDLLRAMWSKNRRKDVFGNELPPSDPWSVDEQPFEGTIEELIGRNTDPYNSGS